MTSRISSGVIAAFLMACLMLGGSSRDGHIANFVLQIAGVLLLAWGAYRLDWSLLRKSEKALIGIGLLGAAIVALQLVPLSDALWRELPGRGPIAVELALLGLAPDPAMVTLSLHETIISAAALLPPVGLVIAILAARSVHAGALAATIVAMALVSLAIGIGQVLGGSDSPLYFYDFTNRGFMVGFFANANHMASLLLVTLPFLAALIAEGRKRFPERRKEFTVLGFALLALIAMGVGLVGSLTGYALLAPVALVSALIVRPPKTKRFAGLLTLPALALSAGLLSVMGDAENIFADDTQASLLGREQIRANAVPMARAFFPVGSGLGTFEEVYRRFEEEGSVNRTFINHAHNEYLEIAVELGAPGLLLMALFVGWWFTCLASLLKTGGSAYGWAGWTAIGVLLVHSGWDYPLRTAALSAILAISCVMAASGSLGWAAKQKWQYRAPAGD
jgi:O-antigen ligase